MLIYLKGEDLQVCLKYNSWITINVMGQEISINQEKIMKEAVEQHMFIIAQVSLWSHSQLLYLPSCSNSLFPDRWNILLP